MAPGDLAGSEFHDLNRWSGGRAMNRRFAAKSIAKWSNLLYRRKGMVRCRVSGEVAWACAHGAPSRKKERGSHYFHQWPSPVALTRNAATHDAGSSGAERIGRLVVFALRMIFRASVEEAENRVVHVLTGCEHSETFSHVVAACASTWVCE